MFRIFKLKKVWIPLILIIIITGWLFYKSKQNNKPQYTTTIVVKQNLIQTVSATGTVKAAKEVNTNFTVSGRLVSLPIKVGDAVRVGTVLARLETNAATAALLTARANLKSAVANLTKIKLGAQSEDIAVSQAAVDSAQTALDNIKRTQTQAINSALHQLVGLPSSAIPAKGNISTSTITVNGTYTGTEQGIYTIRIDNPSNIMYSTYGLENIVGTEGSKSTPTPLGTRGLKIQFSASGTLVAGDTWTIEIPNSSHTSYATLMSAYESALVTERQQIEVAERSLAQAKAQLALKIAPAREYDVLNAEAQIESAQAALVKAQTDLNNHTLLSPVTGVVIKINNEVGEQNSLTAAVAVISAEGAHEIETQVPEADIAKLKVGQTTDITLDAFGSSKHFDGHIAFIDPASTVIQDVVYYKVTVLFDTNDDQIKSGMTANLDIVSDKRDNVLVIPVRAVKYNTDRKAYVEILNNEIVKQKTMNVGLRGDDGLVEVMSGLSEGEQVITAVKNTK